MINNGNGIFYSAPRPSRGAQDKYSTPLLWRGVKGGGIQQLIYYINNYQYIINPIFI